MVFGYENLTWNTFYGSYFKEGVSVEGDVSLESGYKLNLGTKSLTSTLLGYLSSISSNVQTQLDTITTAVGLLQAVSLTSLMISYLSTISSNVQTQIDDINGDISSLQTVTSSPNIICPGYLELGGNDTFTVFDMKNSEGNTDFDVRLGCSSGSSTTSGKGILEITTSKVTTTGDIYIALGKSLYVTDSTLTNYIRIHHDGSNSFLDFSGKLYLRKSETWILKIDTTNELVLYYNINCNGISNSTNGITNNSTLNQVGPSTFTGLATFSATDGLINNGQLEQNGISVFSGEIQLNATLKALVGVTFSGGITNSGYAIENKSTLNQKGNALFSGGINNHTNGISNNSTLSQVGIATFTATPIFNGGITNNGSLTTGDIYVGSGKSIYVTNTALTAFSRMHHNGYNAYNDYSGSYYLRGNSGVTDVFNADSSTYQGKFYYNLNTSGITNITNTITNNSTLSQVGLATFTGGITNNGELTQNSNVNLTSTLNVSGTPTFYCNGSLPSTSTGGSRGLGLYWNVMSGGGYGETSYLNYSQGGGGGHSWYYANTATAPTILMNLNSGKNLSLLNNVSCNSITATGAISCGKLTCTDLEDSGSLLITNKAMSDSPTTGALVVSGGVGIAGALNVLTNSNFTNKLSCGSFQTTTIDAEKATLTTLFSNYFNYSKYVTVRGMSYRYVGGAFYHIFENSLNGGQAGTAGNFSLVIPNPCISMQCQYSYYCTGAYNFQGIIPYYYLKSGRTTWEQIIGTTIGSYSVQPALSVTYSITSESTEPIFSFNTTLHQPSHDGDTVYFTYNIWFY